MKRRRDRIDVKGPRTAEAEARRRELDRNAFGRSLTAARLVAGTLFGPRVVATDDVAAAFDNAAWFAARDLAPGAVLA
jgi:hypothetical protein